MKNRINLDSEQVDKCALVFKVLSSLVRLNVMLARIEQGTTVP